MRDEHVRVLGNRSPQILTLGLAAHPKGTRVKRGDWAPEDLDSVDRDRFIEQQRRVSDASSPFVGISLDGIFVVAARQHPMAGRLLREPREEPVHRLLAPTKK